MFDTELANFRQLIWQLRKWLRFLEMPRHFYSFWLTGPRRLHLQGGVWLRSCLHNPKTWAAEQADHSVSLQVVFAKLSEGGVEHAFGTEETAWKLSLNVLYISVTDHPSNPLYFFANHSSCRDSFLNDLWKKIPLDQMLESSEQLWTPPPSPPSWTTVTW